MRANGIPEGLITGESTDLEKFEAWARTVPYTLGNPLYHWTHMELAFPFGLRDRLLDPRARAGHLRGGNARLHEDGFSVLGLLGQCKVAVVCTTDDPADSLAHHEALARRPRPDDPRLSRPGAPTVPSQWTIAPAFRAWVDRLEAAAGVGVSSFAGLLDALDRRHEAFAEAGCRASDHGLETLEAKDVTERQAASVFAKARSGKPVTLLEAPPLPFASCSGTSRSWTPRAASCSSSTWERCATTTSRLLERLGADSGCDSIGDFEMARPLSRFLGGLDAAGKLAKTVIYNLNPRDNELFAAMAAASRTARCPARSSTAPPGGSSTRRTASRRRCADWRTWACSRCSSA